MDKPYVRPLVAGDYHDLVNEALDEAQNADTDARILAALQEMMEERLQTFRRYNVEDQIEQTGKWYGPGSGGFYGFLSLVRARNPNLSATKKDLWNLCQHFGWEYSTFNVYMYTIRSLVDFGWGYSEGRYFTR